MVVTPRMHASSTAPGRPGSSARARAWSTRRGRASRGLTLIEILVVLFIVALMVYSVAISTGAASQAEVVRTTNQLASTLRFAYDRARFTGQHYRLHIDLGSRSFQLEKAEEAMYLPSTDRDGKLAEVDTRKLEDQAERDKRAAENYYSSIAAAVYENTDADVNAANPYGVQRKEVPRRRPPLFQAFEGDDALLEGLGAKIELPEGVEIISVQTDSDLEPITEGEANIYFFPRGQTQLAHIQIKGKPKLRERIVGEEDIEYTIILQPLTGKVRVEAELIPLELPKIVGDKEDELGNELERRSF